ncbi:chromosome partitioning protein ParA [Cupriavidus necator]|uniref:chromosome partitioning protein ParA n=1 Tax=Cupriavidus necator TaxID=106590 RepID=UPI003ED0E5CA
MKNIPGCKRMIFIRAGNYDYAEVDFEGSIHLVGRNNVGKTSIISAVQFLFIGDQSDMRFDGYSLEDTRRYYFKHPTSYILFECLSSETHSYVTVGLRGLGPIGSYRFERFAFPGRFEREMFIDEAEKVRDFEDVKADILEQRKHFRMLEPKDLRNALTGVWEDRRLNLGIVPLRDGAAQERFVHLFRNLLKLSKMEQETIKQTLVEVYRREFTKPTIDLQKDHEASFAKLEKENRSIQQLEQIKPHIDDLKAALETQGRTRATLKPMYAALLAARDMEEAKLQGEKLAADEVADKFGERQEKLVRQASELGRTQINIGVRLTAIAQASKEVSDLEKAFEGFDPDFEAVAVNNLKNDIERLQQKYYTSAEKVSDIQGDITKLEAERAEKVRLRDRHDKLFGAYLVKEVGENQVKDVFRVLNPRLLEQEVGEEGITVSDSDALVSALNHVDRLIDADERRFEGHGIGFPMNIVPGTKGVIPDVEQLAADIQALDEKIRMRQATLADALERESLQRTIKEKEDARDQGVRKMEAHVVFQQKKRDVEGIREEERQLTAQRDDAMARNQDIVLEQGRLATEFAQAQAKQVDIAGRLARIMRENFDIPAGEWPDGDTAQFDGIPYAALAERYRGSCVAEANASEKVSQRLSFIEATMMDGLVGSSPEEKAQSAVEALDSLDEKRASYDNLWSALVTQIKSSIGEMLGDVSRLKDKVAEFNRRLSNVPVSNLKSVSMEVVENRDRIRSYQQLFNSDGLFGGEAETKRAVAEVSNLIRGATGKVTLQELFGIEFVVEYANGKTKHFPKLDTIESTGTTMMIKALVNMVLMRDMMKKDRKYSVPFYIDECNMVDEINLKGLAQTALSLGFMPVLASTMAVAVAETLYYVHWAREGRAVIEPKNRVRRRELRGGEREAA